MAMVGIRGLMRKKPSGRRKTPNEILTGAHHEQVDRERLHRRVTAHASSGDAERDILYRTQRRALGSLEPTTGGLMRQAHPPRK